MSTTRLIREDFTSLHLTINGQIYRPAHAFRGHLDQIPMARLLAHMEERLDPEIKALYPEAAASVRDQLARLTKASHKKTSLRSRDRPGVRLLGGSSLAEVGPHNDIWATGHPADTIAPMG